MNAPAAEPETPLPESPGSAVRAARERAGLSLEDLAGQTKLSKATLDALEHDDFAQLKEPVYVRGYYRKVAKVLPVDAAGLLAAYEARVKPKALLPPSRIHLAGGVASGPSRRQRRQGLYVSIAFGVLLGLLLWMASDDSVPRTPQSLTPSDTLPVPAIEEPLPEPVAAPAAGATAPMDSPSPTVSNVLALQFTEASWVRVEDGRSKTLLIGLVRAGERKQLSGEAPYTVFLGNAQKVKLEYGQRPFDFSRHIQPNDTARFTVP